MRIVVVALLLLLPLFQADSAAQGSAEAGKEFWESAAARCRDCHGISGEGGFGPDLAGRQLSPEQFNRAVRNPWGIMPAFTVGQLSDQNLANMHAYFQSLPQVRQPGPWRVPLPASPKLGEQLLIATVGCAQCHGAAFGGPRADAGAIDADYEWFRNMVYRHTTVMNQHRALIGEEPAFIRMGNYAPTRLPESLLPEMWRYIKEDLKFRVPMAARLGPAAPAGANVTHMLTVENPGLVGKGLAAEDVTIELRLATGVTVVSATGTGYQGVRRDPQGNTDMAVWQVPRVGPKDHQTYTITLSGGPAGPKVERGTVRWTRPAQGDGSGDQVNVAMPPAAPPQTATR